jgi:hypothetical protein
MAANHDTRVQLQAMVDRDWADIREWLLQEPDAFIAIVDRLHAADLAAIRALTDEQLLRIVHLAAAAVGEVSLRADDHLIAEAAG